MAGSVRRSGKGTEGRGEREGGKAEKRGHRKDSIAGERERERRKRVGGGRVAGEGGEGTEFTSYDLMACSTLSICSCRCALLTSMSAPSCGGRELTIEVA